jgi:hypothetical protein
VQRRDQQCTLPRLCFALGPGQFTQRASVSPFHSLVTRCSSLPFSLCPLRARSRHTPQCAGPIMPREAREKAGRAASTGILHVCLISGGARSKLNQGKHTHPGRHSSGVDERKKQARISLEKRKMEVGGKCRATQVEHSSHGDAQRSGIARAARFVPPLLALRIRLALVRLSRVRTGVQTTP